MDRRRLLQAASGLGIIFLSSSGQAAAAVSNTAQSTGGNTLWESEIGGSVKSSPTVSDGTVFVGGYDGSMYAMDTESGDQQWSFETDSRGFWASPIVVDDSVCIGSLDGTLYLLDAASGDVRWSVETDGNFLSSPVVADGTIFGVNWSEHVFAYDTESSEIQWTVGLPQQVNSSLTVADGTVFFGTADSTLYAVDAETGSQQWSFDTGGRIRSSPTVADGSVFVGSNDTNLYALDADSGDLQWVFETDGEIGISSPTVADRTVFVGSGDSHLYAVDAATGEQQWAVETNDGVASSPTVANGTVFVGSNDDNLYAVDAATGDRLWSFETGDSVISSPTVVDGTVFVGSDDATVYAIDAGVEGSSEGSRTQLGTLGHHDGWRYATQSISTETDANVELSLDAPDEVPPDWSFSVEATAANNGVEDDQVGVTLFVDGTAADSVDSIAAGDSATLSTTVKTGADGSRHELSLESRDGSQRTEQEVAVTAAAAIDIQYDKLHEGSLQIPQEEDAVISAETTAEPRSDAEIRVYATESSVSFDRRTQVSIGEDGSVQASIDASSVELGTDLETQFWVGGNRVDAIDSFVVELPPSATTERLAVDLSTATVQADERTDVTVTVTAADTGEPVDGATVEIADLQRSSTTTATGETTLTVTPPQPGSYPIEVSAAGFSTLDRTLTVEPSEDEQSQDTEPDDGSGTDDTVTVELPGFGIGETITAVGAVGYVLKRRLTDSD